MRGTVAKSAKDRRDAESGVAPFDLQRMWPLVSVATLVIAFTIWWTLTSGLKLIAPLYFPRPEAVAERLADLRTVIVGDALWTLGRVVVSWLLGSAMGVTVGLLMIRSRLAFFLLTPLVEALRPVPPIALIPFVILWFGIGETGKIFLAALGCFMVMAVNTIVAARNVPPVYLRAARSLGASENTVYRTVILPAIVPQLVAGLRIGAALAFAVTIAAEFMGAEAGIGALIMLASRTLGTDVVLLGTIIIGLEAFGLEQLIRLISDRATVWAERSHD